jgi:hypothetical protein
MSTTAIIRPAAPSLRAKLLAHLLSYVVTLKFISNSASWLRSYRCDWFALMESKNRNYRVRQWLIELGYDTGQIRAIRALNQRDASEAEVRAERALEASHWHSTYGSVCPACGRADLGHGIYCVGGLVRRHAPLRRRGAIVSYYD